MGAIIHLNFNVMEQYENLISKITTQEKLAAIARAGTALAEAARLNNMLPDELTGIVVALAEKKLIKDEKTLLP